jgi:hypothetical protein
MARGGYKVLAGICKESFCCSGLRRATDGDNETVLSTGAVDTSMASCAGATAAAPTSD